MQWTADETPAAAIADRPLEACGPRARRPRDMSRWERSRALADVVTFVERVNRTTARGETGTPVTGADENVRAAIGVLRAVRRWAENCGPDDCETVRFDRFHRRLRAGSRDLLSDAYAAAPAERRAVELPEYLNRSFGDPATAAYGAEHELSFCMFLVALYELNRLTAADDPFVAPVLFQEYLETVDYLIDAYHLTGSREERDRTGLDAYDRHLPYLWGSAQLMAADRTGGHLLMPSSLSDRDAIRKHRDECPQNLLTRCVDRVLAAGPEPLWLHSYALWNLSGLPTWSRVNAGLSASFPRVALDRFDTVKRLVFGELLRWTEPDPGPQGSPDNGNDRKT